MVEESSKHNKKKPIRLKLYSFNFLSSNQDNNIVFFI